MSSRVLLVVVTALGLLLAVTEAIEVVHRPTTQAPNLDDCSESVKLVPVLHLVTPGPSPSPPTRDPLPLPRTTTRPALNTQTQGTTSPTTHTTTMHHPQQPTPLTPTPANTQTPPSPKEHTTLHGKLKEAEHLEKHDTDKLDHTLILPHLSPYSTETTRFPSSSSSFSFSTRPPVPPPPVRVNIPRPNLTQRTSTLPPPPLTLPLPTTSTSSTTSTPMLRLQQVGEQLRRLGDQLQLVLTAGWAREFRRPYLQRIKAVSLEIVNKVLQADYEVLEATIAYGNTTCHLPEERMSHLFHSQTLLLLLLQTFPRSLEEVEEAMRVPEITDYIFRPEKKAVFDVYGCRECYALDFSGVCREVFFCKAGVDVFSRTSRRSP